MNSSQRPIRPREVPSDPRITTAAGLAARREAGLVGAERFAGMTVGAIVRRRRGDLGLTLQRLAELAGCAKSYLSSIENERRESPASEELLGKVEGALGLAPGVLVGAARWQAMPEAMRAEMTALKRKGAAADRLAALLRGDAARPGKLDELHRSGRLERLLNEMVLGRERGEAAAARVSKASGEAAGLLPLEVPLINLVQAGPAREFTDLGYPVGVADEYVRAPDVGDADAFAARVTGDSMLPEYREGDIVVFSPARPVKSGMDCYARLLPDHETTFKRVYFESDAAGRAMVRLQPLNSAYPPRVVEREAVDGLCAAVTVTRAIAGA
jgi:phage repressor protein C with HTH and peptisase S24 domain